jgi:ABC-type multidrug transport system permease subunit
MLSKMILDMYSRFLEISLWISLLLFVIGGWNYDGATGSLLGFLAWVVFSVVFFGAFLLIADIQQSVQKIASSK